MMNKKSLYLFIIFSFFTLLLVGEIWYLQNFKTPSQKEIRDKNIYMKIVALPDLAISNEAMFVRHRSLSDIFSLFPDSPSLSEYFPSTFTYKYSNTLYLTPNRIEREK